MATFLLYITVLFGRDPPKVALTPKTAAFRKYATNILCEEKHVHRIVLVLPKPNKASKTTIEIPNSEY